MGVWCKPVATRVAVALVAGVAGCKLPHPTTTEIPGEVKPALLVGPEAAGEAPAVELPAAESAKLCLRTAQEFERNEQVEDAIRLYQKARSLDPAVARQATRRLAVLYDLAGEFGKSAAEYEALLKASPKDPEVLNDVGYGHYCRGEWAAAETYLEQAVRLDPANKRASINLGLARAQQGKLAESYEAFCAAVRPADAHCNIAFVLASQGKPEEAKSRYRQALALDPSLRLAQSVLARLEQPPAPIEPRPDAAPRKTQKYDPAKAAETVPTVQQLEARMRAAAEAAEPGRE